MAVTMPALMWAVDMREAIAARGHCCELCAAYLGKRPDKAINLLVY